MRTLRSRKLRATRHTGGAPKEKKPAARDLKAKDAERLMEILDSNLAASGTTDDAILDSPTLDGYSETIREDIETLADNGHIVAPTKVAIASLVAKIWYPEWDTRKHQVAIGGLKSLRTVDHSFVAKHLHSIGLYRTATEGMLTRSFEAKHPFTMDYPGEINPTKSKLAFLRIVNRINLDYSQPLAETMLRYFFKRLQAQMEGVNALASTGLVAVRKASLKDVRDILSKLFGPGAGLSATPAIVIHTAFSIAQVYIWTGVEMTPLKRHTASDSTSKAIGDVEAYRGESPFLSVEVKHKLDIDDTIIRTFTQKTGGVPLRFILTTKAINPRYTEDNILIGNVSEIALQYLHMVSIHDPDVAVHFLTRLREALVGSPDIGGDNKSKISTIIAEGLA